MKISGKLAFSFVVLVLILAGCAPQVQRPMRICLPKQTVAESLAELANNAQNLRPIRASGTCLFRYSVDGKKHKENFPVKLWFSPPSCIYLQGDAAFDPKAICLGSNETEFWFSIKPETSTYWWGRYDRVKHCFGNFLLAPGLDFIQNLLEALGAVAVDSAADWTLSKHGEFDLLTKTDSDNAVVKKIYVGSRDYLPRKVEYFSEDGQSTVIIELNKYKKLGEDFYLPKLIKITGATTDSSKDSIRITLRSLKKAEFSQKIFLRRPPRGFRYIKELNADCQWAEQSH